MGKGSAKKRAPAPAPAAAPVPSGTTDTVARMLQSSNHFHRVDGCNAIASTFSGEHLTALTSSGCLSSLVKLVEDKVIVVATSAIGALRNVTVEAGEPVARSLIPLNVVPTVLQLLGMVDAALAAVDPATGRVVVPEGAPALHWYGCNASQLTALFSQSVGFLSVFLAASPAAADAVAAGLAASQCALLGQLLSRAALLAPAAAEAAAAAPLDRLTCAHASLSLLQELASECSPAAIALASNADAMAALSTLASAPAAAASLNAPAHSRTLAAMRDGLVRQLRRKEGAFVQCFTAPPAQPGFAAAAVAASAIAFALNESLSASPPSARPSPDAAAAWAATAAATLVGVIEGFDAGAHAQHLAAALVRVQDMIQAARSGALAAAAERGEVFPVSITAEDAGLDSAAHAAAVAAAAAAEDASDDAALSSLEAGAQPMDSASGDSVLPVDAPAGFTAADAAALAEEEESLRSKELPLDAMWGAATETLVRGFAAATDAVDAALEGFAALLEVFPDAEAPASSVSPAETAAASAVAARVTPATLNAVGSLCTLRLLPAASFAPGAAEAAAAAGRSQASLMSSLPAPAAQALLAVLPRHGAHQFGEVADTLRARACATMAAVTALLPAAAFGATPEAAAVAQGSLFAALAPAVASHDLTPLLAPAGPAPSARALASALKADAPEPAVAYGAVGAEEMAALAAALLHLRKRPEWQQMVAAAWGKAPAAVEAVAAAEPGADVVAALAALLGAPAGCRVPSSLRSAAAGALATVAQTPSAGSAAVSAVLKALLEPLLTQAKLPRGVQMDLATVYECVMGVIDAFSEDDRYVAEYKASNATSRLAAFASFYKAAFKEAVKRHTALASGKARLGKGAADAEEIAASEALLAKTEEGVDNIVGFSAYKRSLGL